MEKLQKALSNARLKREGSAPLKRRRVNATYKQNSGSADEIPFPPAWDKLSVYEPDPDLLISNRIITLNAQPEANPFDVLRTKVFLLMQQNGWKRLGITSPNKGCGKTVTACNLAVGFSRQKEVKSLLLDLDLRRPSIASTLGYKPKHDTKEVLLGEVTAEEQMVRLRSNVAISMAKHPVHDPTQILLSQQAHNAFDDIQRDFDPDIMIFDLPPMLVTDDARAILPKFDCALIVARAEQTRVSQLDVCEREVAELTNVLGVVLNNCRHLSPEEEYDSDY